MSDMEILNCGCLYLSIKNNKNLKHKNDFNCDSSLSYPLKSHTKIINILARKTGTLLQYLT